MDKRDLAALTQEIENYKSTRQYAECIHRMDQYEQETTDPVVRAVLLTAKATCALEVNDIPTADSAASRIDISALTIPMRNYVNLTKASVARDAARPEEAAVLLSESLATKEIHSDEQREVLYESLAMMGFIQADMNCFSAALDLLLQASALINHGELRENIGLYRAYCLQALGRLQEAEECLKSLLSDGSSEFDANVFYRLGAIHLQQEDFGSAIRDFQNALMHEPHGRIRRSDILAALDEANQGLGLDCDSGSIRPLDKPRIQ